MSTLDDPKVGIRAKLASLWASLMFCYVYGDFFGLFVPGRLRDMIAGNFGPLGPTTQGVLIGVSLLMAVPAVMIFGSLTLPAALCRWTNVLLGTAYTAIMLLTMQDALPFYLVLGTIEVLVSAAIGIYAWRWPRSPTMA